MNLKKCFRVVGMSLASSGLFSCVGELDEGDRDEDQVGKAVSPILREGHSWQHGDWTSRVLYEARYALNKNANGTSGVTQGSGAQQKWYGDWDYVSSDAVALAGAQTEAAGFVGTLSPALTSIIPGKSVYRGGWCTFFVRLVLYRSTYYNFVDHYTTPGFPDVGLYTIQDSMTQVYSNVQSGWVLLTPKNTHYAIAERREIVDGNVGWWVIDSNYVCSYCIGRHFFSDASLKTLGYYGWKPDRGTNNK